MPFNVCSIYSPPEILRDEFSDLAMLETKYSTELCYCTRNFETMPKAENLLPAASRAPFDDASREHKLVVASIAIKGIQQKSALIIHVAKLHQPIL
jgi:hypothetical protein